MPVSDQDKNEILKQMRDGRAAKLTREGLKPADTNNVKKEDGAPRNGVEVPPHHWGLRCWHETEQGLTRLQQEIPITEEVFPSFTPQVDADGLLRWVGTLCAHERPDEEYVVVVTCRNGYLGGEMPDITIVDPPLRADAPHRFRNGDLCVEHGDYRATTPIVDLLSWTTAWITLYSEFVRTGVRW